MKNTDKQRTTNEETTFTTVDAVELDGVTGGCAACGCSAPTAAAGAAPVVGGTRLNPFAAMVMFGRR